MNEFPISAGRRVFAAAGLGLAIAPGLAATAAAAPPRDASPDVDASFDFLVGDWRVRHRKLKRRLAGNDEWLTFSGRCAMRKILGGRGNVEENVFDGPGGAYEGFALRLCSPADGTWSIWWVDSRDPTVTPPVVGRFHDGVGTFFGDEQIDGKPVRVRFVWSHITPSSARWEQAFSPDAGATWETNWSMDFERVS